MPVSTEVYARIHVEGLSIVKIQNQLIATGSTEVSSKMFDGGTVHEMGLISEVGNLVSCIGCVSERALIGEFELSDNGAVSEPMVIGR